MSEQTATAQMVMPKHGEFCWNDLATTNVEACRRFYGELLGWKFKESDATGMNYSEISVDGQKYVGGIWQTDQCPEGETNEMPPPHWRDRNGNTHYVDYVEWHTVADILDENAPNWSHAVKDIRQIGDIFTVTVAITIDGVTREGIGTGTAESELGIKKAEHDALKRAAVKFGIARDLYKKESDTIEREGAVPPTNNDGFPANPIAKSLSDLVTAKQLGMIRAISREIGIEADEECQNVMQCKTDELSKKAASGFIQHLQEFQKNQEVSVPQPMRRAG